MFRLKDSYAIGEKLFYLEDGAMLLVTVVENRSNKDHVAYIFRTEETVVPHPICGPKENGSVFDCFEDRNWEDSTFRLEDIPTNPSNN